MKRVMVTVVDMTTPSAPGRPRTMSIADEDPAVVREGLIRWVVGAIEATLAGDRTDLEKVLDDLDSGVDLSPALANHEPES